MFEGVAIMENDKRLIMNEQDAIVAAEHELSVCRYIAECTRNPGMLAIHRKRCEWLSVIIKLAKKAIKGDAVEVVHARWVRYEHGSGIYCSHCRHKRRYRNAKDNYCPNCGANMDGGNEDG